MHRNALLFPCCVFFTRRRTAKMSSAGKMVGWGRGPRGPVTRCAGGWFSFGRRRRRRRRGRFRNNNRITRRRLCDPVSRCSGRQTVFTVIIWRGPQKRKTDYGRRFHNARLAYDVQQRKRQHNNNDDNALVSGRDPRSLTTKCRAFATASVRNGRLFRVFSHAITVIVAAAVTCRQPRRQGRPQGRDEPINTRVFTTFACSELSVNGGYCQYFCTNIGRSSTVERTEGSKPETYF